MKCRILQTQAHFHLLQEYIERGISIYFCKIFYKPGRLVLLTFLLSWSKCCLPGVIEPELIWHTVTYIFTIMSCATALHNYSNFWRFVCRSLKVVLMLGKKKYFSVWKSPYCKENSESHFYFPIHGIYNELGWERIFNEHTANIPPHNLFTVFKMIYYMMVYT